MKPYDLVLVKGWGIGIIDSFNQVLNCWNVSVLKQDAWGNRTLLVDELYITIIDITDNRTAADSTELIFNPEKI